MDQPPSQRDYTRSTAMNLDIVVPLLLLPAFGIMYAISPDVLKAVWIAIVPVATAVYRDRLSRYWQVRSRGSTETLMLGLLVVNIRALYCLYEGVVVAFGQRPVVSAMVIAGQMFVLALIVGLRLGWLLPDRQDIVRLPSRPGGPVDPLVYTQRQVTSLNEQLASDANREDEKE